MEFTQNTWDKVLEALQLVNKDIAAELKDNKIARHIASVSFVANSTNPARYAVSNVLTYYAALKLKDIFGHNKSDDADFGARLDALYFGDGDVSVIETGVNLLKVVTINNHKKDKDDDVAFGRHNPIASGAWTTASTTELSDILASDPNIKLYDSADYLTNAPWWGI